MCSFEIIMLCACVRALGAPHPYQLSNQLADFHEIWYESYVIADHLAVVIFNLLKVINNSMVNTLTYEMQTTIEILNIES
jgi:hypothetical protein